MNLLPALVVGLTAGLLAVQDCHGEKRTKEKEPERAATYSVETPLPASDEEVEEGNKMEETYEQIVKDEYLLFPMEEDISEEIGDDPEEEEEAAAEGESIREITEDEYDEGAFNFDRVGLMYFTEDHILCDSDMVTIDNVGEWLGNVDLETQPDEIVVKWIRNFDLSYDIRLEIIGDAYSGSR
ncbi:MAG TPA: hypothetical protein [Siphovirus UK_ancient_CT89]|nr:MAG TPA: hypothetical protein [Siphovirus UK_ancient_CT89]